MSNEKIYDWIGNEVKAGMTIYFVDTAPMLTGRFGMAVPDGKGGHTETWESDEDYEKRQEKYKDYWELGNPMEVVDVEGSLFVVIKYENDPDVDQVSFPIHNMFGKKPIIAIKGISDKQPIEPKRIEP